MFTVRDGKVAAKLAYIKDRRRSESVLGSVRLAAGKPLPQFVNAASGCSAQTRHPRLHHRNRSLKKLSAACRLADRGRKGLKNSRPAAVRVEGLAHVFSFIAKTFKIAVF